MNSTNEVNQEQIERSTEEKRPFRRLSLGKIVLFAASLFLFIQAIMLMKAGAHALAPLLHQQAIVTNPANGLGFGWLCTYLLLSGSPVAAAALTFLDAGLLDAGSTFAMISGSRLGASFIVLFIGFIYVLRGRDRVNSLSMGLLSLTVTGTTYLVTFFIGLGMLQRALHPPSTPTANVWLTSFIDKIFMPLVRLLTSTLPHWSLLLVGLGLILLSFHLFDHSLPQMAIKESQVGQVSRFVYRPWVMLLLGATVTLVSMSVSVSLSLLVPLSDRGLVRRENVIPYIMGTNITTFIDTLFAALLLETGLAFTVVWVQIVSIIIVSAVILAFFYRRYERAMLAGVAWITDSTGHLALFMLIIVVFPLILLFV